MDDDTKPSPKRKVIQLCDTPDTLFALCDDGTIWFIDRNGAWKQRDTVPAE